MNNLQELYNYNGLKLRVIIIDSRPWFVAKDVADVLGYVWNGTRTVEHVPAQWRGVESVPTPYGNQEMAVLSEQGLYFFLNRSDKSGAVPFQMWVSGDVLPSIRQTGSYALVPKTLPEALRAYANEVERRQALEAENIKMLPKAEFHDRVTASEGEMTMEAAAKELGTGRNRLFRDLREKKILKSNNLPMQEYLDRGYFRVVQNPLRFGGEDKPYAQTMVTGKGLAYLSRLLIAR